MKITLNNDSDRPVYVTFDDGGDYDMLPGAQIELELQDGSQINLAGEYLKTEKIARP